MKIKSVALNNKKKTIEIETNKEDFSLPFSRLVLRPTAKNRIVKIYVDKQLANRGVTYLLESGAEDSIHLDAFMDYNKDPEFIRQTIVHQLTVKALELLKKCEISKHEMARRLKTSPSQLYRLLDPANRRKSIDEMLKLLSVLGYRIEWKLVKEVA